MDISFSACSIYVLFSSSKSLIEDQEHRNEFLATLP